MNILAVGTDSDHMLRYIKYCDEQNANNIQIEVFLTSLDKPVSIFNREDSVYGVRTPGLLKPLMRLPHLNNVLKKYLIVSAFRKLIRRKNYSLICIHQLHPYTFPITKLATRKGIKVMLTPWGSDVLRATEKQKMNLSKAFELASYVSSDLSIGFTEKFVQMYGVSRSKLVDAWYGSDVISSIYKQKKHLDKSTVAGEFGLPSDCYYITCGYAANRAQRHTNMIEAIGKNKSLFPRTPVLVFPFTYGPDKTTGYQNELESVCEQYALEYCFVRDYMLIEKVARLRLLSDLYFHILPTDAYSASLIEYILAGSICINGKWLDYPSLEHYQKPYYVCDSLELLPDLVNKIFSKDNPVIPILKETEQIIMSGSWEVQIKNWYRFFDSFIDNKEYDIDN